MTHPPLQGIGLGLRMEFSNELVDTDRELDWIEILAENWIGRGGMSSKLLARYAERWQLVPHSVSMSVGGLDSLDRDLFAQMATLCRTIRAPFWSDHICYARVDGVYLHDLLPLPFNEEVVDHVVRRIREAQRLAEVPLVFENATFYSHMPGCSMNESTFLRTILEQADCQMLLDVNNVYVNSCNHGFDPYAFIDEMPLSRVVQLHLAGHTNKHGTIIDTHQGPIIDDVWNLYRHVLRRAGRLIPTLIEWDSGLPADVGEVIDEVDRCRREAALALGGIGDAG